MLTLSEKEYEQIVGKRAVNKIKNADSEVKKEEIREQNSKSLSTGKAFEELISLSCKKYKKDGEACIMKTPEPFTIFRRTKDGFFQGRFTASKAQPDFQGTIIGGRSFIAEAKSTKHDRIAQSVLTDTQAEMLEENDKLGAVAMVLASINNRNFAIPYTE